MIKLDLKDYCQGCPCFEAAVEKTELVFNHEWHTDFTIRCKHRGVCYRIHKYVEEEQKNKETKE